MRSLFDHGVVVAAASDYPVSPPPDPLLAIQRGVLRRDPLAPELSSELWPQEAVSVEELIAAFTVNGAYANFLEHETGSLEVGKSADLVVLRENILELPAERVNEATVQLTLFRGTPTFAAGAYEGWTWPEGPGVLLRRRRGRRAYRRVDSRSSSDRGSSRRGSAGVSPRTSSISMSAASRPRASAL